MMKAVMISNTPATCVKLAKGKCTILVRKTRPKMDTPFKAYIYCTDNSGTLFIAYDGLHDSTNYVGRFDLACLNSKVIGEFVCDKVYKLPFTPAFQDYDFTEIYQDNNKSEYFSLHKTCLTQNEIYEYGKGKTLYGWHVSNLIIYDTPKSLEMFPTGKIARDCGGGNYMVYDKILTRPPRDWCYVQDKEN